MMLLPRCIPFASRAAAHAQYAAILAEAEAHGPEAIMGTMAALGRADLFFLLTRLMRRSDADNDWCFARCKEVAAQPDGMLDLWSREHYKSTIITVALSIQEIVRDPEISIGLFSHTRPSAKGFLAQIKREFEQNEALKHCYPDVLYRHPHKESPQWSMDHGIIGKRQSNPKESTVEAWGVVDGQPIGKHFKLLVYDDVVTPGSVNTPEQIAKTTEYLRLSYALGAQGGAKRFIGTRYHLFDTYAELLKEGSVTPRIHPATVDGTPEGEPVFLTRADLAQKRLEMGPYIFACQMLLNPLADSAQGFKQEWLRWWKNEPAMRQGQNVYILADPAGEKKKNNDYSVFWVLGLGADGHIYIIDCVRDRLNLTQRASVLFALVRQYQPIAVGYEKYSMQADIEHIQQQMLILNYHFTIIPLGGQMPKNDRIRRLVPDFENGRVHFPLALPYRDVSGAHRNLLTEFIEEEYTAFPVCKHDDMLDCLARIKDEGLRAFAPAQQDMGGSGGIYDIVSSTNPHICAGVEDYDPLAAYR